MKRVLTAIVLGPLALAAVFLLPRVGFLVCLALLVGIATLEAVRIGRRLDASRAIAALPVTVLGAAWLLLARLDALPGAGLPDAERTWALTLLLTSGIGLWVLVAGGSVRQRAVSLGVLGFGTLYFALPIVAFDRLRADGPWPVVFLLAVVWATDAGAFYSGSLWGRRKLAPLLSPKKTWEGAVGGLALGILAGAVWSLGPGAGLSAGTLAAAALVSIVGQAGDLIESLYKRLAGVKDSGNLLPGHGGMLDRLDSLLLAAPALAAVVSWLEG